jgi:hypothetical protein
MRPKRPPKKLSLNQETIRLLSGSDLHAARGGDCTEGNCNSVVGCPTAPTNKCWPTGVSDSMPSDCTLYMV